MRKVTLFLAFMLMAVNAFAQLSRITGTVLSDDDGEPIIGATVTVTGTKNSTSTDADGHFTISNLTPSDKTVTVTFIGMESVTAPIAPDMTVRMRIKSEMMDEVVVVA
ncbi:MAG: carboxypeptidase-like regulatory domain-containing protein, partial [Muribaculaceae bacterium]|nr:carboxypeptidase-like regulatory domain-containing protein [Muribaculaceae bacterium]